MRILLVEDNSDHRELMSLALTGHDSTWGVEGVGSGEEALCLLLGGEVFDLVFLDYSLPQRDGLWFLEEIRRGKASPPVVMVTGRGDEGVAVEAMKRGAYDYVVKQEGYLERLPVVARYAMEANRMAMERKQAEETLCESEERYRRLVENAPDVIYSLAEDGTITSLNSAFERITGWSRAEWIGKPFMPLVHPDDLSIAVEAFQQVLRGEAVPPYELRILSKSGGYLFGEFTSVPNIEKGKVMGEFGIARDITERKQMEEALKFTRFSLDHAIDSVVCVGHDGRFIDVNDAFCRSSGYSREELLSMTVHDTDPDYSAEIWPEFWEKLKQAGSLTFESCHRSKEGRVVPVEITANFFEYNGKEYHCGFARDITERKRAEEKFLRQSALLTGINKIFREALLCQTEEELARTCLAVAEQLTGSKFGFIDEINQAGRLDTIALSNPGWDACRLPKSDAPLLLKDMEIRGIPGRVIKDGQTEIANEPASHPAWVGMPEGHPPVTNFIGIPLKQMDNTIGIIGLANKETGYGAADQETMEVLSVAIVESLMRKRAEEALRESEARYRRITEGMTNYLYTVRVQDGRAVETIHSQACEAVTGYTAEEFAVDPYLWIRMVVGEERDRVIERVQRILAGEEIPPIEHRIVRKDGQIRWVSDTLIQQVDSSGRLVSYDGVIKDITERKRAEEALRQSEERFRSVFHNAFVGMAIVNPEGHVAEANEPFCRFLGYSREELIGRHFTEFTHPEDMSIDSDLYAALLDDERLSYSIDKRYMRKGEVVWGRLSVSLIKDEAGQLENTIVVREDITERKRAEEALRGGEEKYRLLVENANEAIFVVQEERLKFVNRKVLEILGYTQEEITSRPFSDLIHPEDREMVLDNYLRRLRGETVPPTYAFRVIDKDGNTRWVELGAVKIDWEGKPATLSFATDITDRKRAEGEMGLLQEQFRYSQKMEAVGRLAGGVAHDFNNVLTVIRGYSELCLGKLEKTDPLWTKVKGIQRASEQGARLTNQLLTFSRHQVMEMKVIDLNRLFKDLDRMLRRVIGEDIELVTTLAEDLGGIKGDLGQMEQVTMNLAVNARDAMLKGGKLTIEAKNVELDSVFFESHAGGGAGEVCDVLCKRYGIWDDPGGERAYL